MTLGYLVSWTSDGRFCYGNTRYYVMDSAGDEEIEFGFVNFIK